MYNKEPTEKQKVGRFGEDLACNFLKEKGFKILDRNYLRKWGEIDVVAKKGEDIHFVEVKSVSREINEEKGEFVPYETKDGYRPEDNMHPWKLQRLSRVIQSYLLEKDISEDVEWKFDVVTVYTDKTKNISKVFMLEDVVL